MWEGRNSLAQGLGIYPRTYVWFHFCSPATYLDTLDRLVQQRHNGYLHTLDRTCNGCVTVVQRNRSAWLCGSRPSFWGLLTFLWRLESPDGPIWVAKRIKGMAFSDLKTQKKSGEAGAVSWRWTLARAGRSLARERLLVKRLPGGARHNGYLDTLDRPAARPPNRYLDTLDRWNQTYLPTQIPESWAHQNVARVRHSVAKTVVTAT